MQIARKNIEYTQEVFAETLDISVGHHCKLEREVYALQPEKMLLLYKTYKIDPTYFNYRRKNVFFDIERFLAKCNIEEREDFISQIFTYMKKMMSRH